MDEHSTEATQTSHSQPGAAHTGPRVSAEEIRDLGRLRRTRNDKYVAGVAGGLARHLDIDPVILRVAFVVLTFFGGAGVLVYGACWLLVPEDGADRAPVDLDIRSRSIALIAVGSLAVLAMIGDAFGEGPGGWVAWPLVVIAAIAWFFLSRRDRRDGRGISSAPWSDTQDSGPVGTDGSWHGTPSYGTTSPYAGPTAPRRTPRADVPRDPRKRGPILFWFTLALIALSLGTLGIFDAAGASVTGSAYPALALGIVALMLLVGAFFGRAGGLILLGCIAAGVLSLSTVADRYDADRIVEAPQSAAQVDDRYDTFAGELVLDLTEVSDPENLDGRTIDLELTFGRVEVIVPEDMDVTVHSGVNAGGNVSLFGRDRDGWDFTTQRQHDGGEDVPVLDLDVEITFGEIEVTTR